MKYLFLLFLYPLSIMPVFGQNQTEKRLKAYVFLSDECPMCQGYAPVLNQLAADFRGKGVDIVGVFPNYYATDSLIPRDGSFLSIAPHMHLVGRRTKVYGLMPNGDTMRLINIPDWDFNWQGAYGFRNVLKFPVGMTLVAESFYDNTPNNPYNPSSPPKLVTLGENTTDEMMLTYFTFMAYQSGDENIVLDSSAIVSNTFDIQQKKRLNLSCFPNLTRSTMTLNFTLPQREICNIDIFALNGVAVKGILRGEWFDKGEHQLPISTADLPSGTYIVRLSSEKTYGIQQFVRVE